MKVSSSLEQQFLPPSRRSKILSSAKVEIGRLLKSLVTEQQGIIFRIPNFSWALVGLRKEK